MFLSEINLQNFRNYSKLKLKFKKNINIFIGNNAQGKTNILESIYFLSITKSHRTTKENFLIKDNEVMTKVTGKVKNESISKKYEVMLNTNGKRVSINDNPIKKISDYLSNINVVMFCPDDLEIIKGTPHNRRYFLNIEIGQLYNDYLKHIYNYNKILKSRNDYLKNNNYFDKVYFDVLTESLIKENIKIIKYRYNYIELINKYITNIYKDLTKKDNIYLKYETFIDVDEEDIMYKKIKEKYNKSFENELFQKVTLYGAHKDDFSVYIDDIKINNYGSQGQHRIAILSIKLAEVEIFKNIKEVKPILLLDDIFSELDKNKKNNIIKYINNDLQVFITSTDLKNVSRKLLKNADIYKVETAKVVREAK
ncbi:MAG: DNA replication/repair protein RecF [Bacilli bacterium]|nr:DNA replication/repair protein RecF [Bacilli bacterium]